MSCHPDIKRTVLKGVYEDNLGIPRSSTGKRQARHNRATPDEPPSPRHERFILLDEEPIELKKQSIPLDERPRQGISIGSKLVLIALLGIVALLGINFRLVYVDSSGPVAMQVTHEQAAPTYITRSGDWPMIPEGGIVEDLNLSASHVPAQFQKTITGAGAKYDVMLGQLGMPMADLFGLKVQTIVIDPGHGGVDPGATGHQGLREKDAALDIGRRLRDKLVKAGNYRVLLTREDDRKVSLKERVTFAKDNHADLFISIHINSLPFEHMNMVETYYFGPHTDPRSLELAEKENHDSDYAMGDFRKVIAKIGDTLKTEESKGLAGSIHQHLYDNMKRQNGDLMDNGSKTGPFVVLLGVEVPSVLVEISCISNKAEETRLSTPGYRDSISGFLKTGIVEYLERRKYRRTNEGGKLQHVARQSRQ